MALARDWELRVDAWLEALGQRIARPIQTLEVQFAPTMEHLTPEQAGRKLSFKPARTGMAWGKEWEYAWFKTKLKIPALPKGKTAVLMATPGDPHIETVIYSHGQAIGGLDRFHHQVELPRAGSSLSLMMESYAGHRYPGCWHQFVLPGEDLLGESKPTRQVFGKVWLAEWNEAAFQLWMDAKTVRLMVKALPADTLRMTQLEQAIKDASCALDVEADQAEFEAAIPSARGVLADVLTAHNGSTMPTLYTFGHSHIDVAWLWPLAQTYRKNAHTFSSMLALMDRYKEFKFLQSQAQLYDYVKAQHPELYQRIRQAVRKGQWIADGGMWVECDMNVTGGEAMIRQFMLGKRFFAQEFGVKSEVCWLPDVFGYSANMPQILSGCGVKYFSTAKIFWNYHGGTTFPYETFTWEGIDGSTLLAHLHRNYNAPTDPESLAQRWKDCCHKPAGDLLAYPFGWGDGGGGPTRQHLEYLRREGDLEGLPRTKMASPAKFFAELEKKGIPADRYVGELYFEAHRGTYSTQAKIKRGNRKTELALREVEMWSALATATKKAKYPAEALDANWKKVLLNQFHDILPGSSIGRVYAEAQALHEEVLEASSELATAARKALLAGPSGGYTVWNSLSWDRDVMVEMPAEGYPYDADGTPLPCQVDGKGKNRKLMVAVPEVPSLGGRTVVLKSEKHAAHAGCECCGVSARQVRGGVELANELLVLKINQRGEISSCIDKLSGRQLVPAGSAMNRLELFKDNPAWFDAWDIDLSYQCQPVPLGAAQSVQIVSAGPLEARVAVRRAVGKGSLVEQHIVLQAASRRVDFPTHVNWQETHRLLKVGFPADLSVPTLRGEIQFGHVVRPTHRNTEFEKQRFEWPAQKWAALSEADFGLAVLNDCKYGYDVLDGYLRLTLLRAAVAPDVTADRGEHDFTYALALHDGPFAQSDIVQQGYDLNVPVTVQPGRLAEGTVRFVQVENAEDLPVQHEQDPVEEDLAEMMQSDSTVLIETLKRSEDGKATIVRLYESMGATALARLRFGLGVRQAWQCNLVEEQASPLKLEKDGSLVLDFRPFEIKTIRLV